MRKILLALSLMTVLLPALALGRVAAAPASSVTVEQNEAEVAFPDALTFLGEFSSDSEITDITLEYGTTTQTCGTVVAKASPEFTPGDGAAVRWRWDMRQSGSLPPGSTLWWQWAVEDASGVTRTPRQTVTWLDSRHAWKTEGGDNANLHWYSGDAAFGQRMHAAAVSALERMEQDTGLKAEAPVDIYVYGTYDDLREAILYEPGWTGGQAFPSDNIVIIGIAPDEAEWGETAIAHELTHVLVGHLTFSCLSSVPTWVNEGLAVYSEGRLDPGSQEQFDQAVQEDTLLPVRSLSGAFSEVAGRAYLSYSQSYSLVKFLLETYGREEMNSLLLQLRDGVAIEEALQAVYGFDVDGLEDAWRAAIGAKPRAQDAQPTARPSPTVVPTIIPFAGVSSENMQATQVSMGLPTATAIPTSNPAAVPTQTVATSPVSRTSWGLVGLGGLAAGCIVGLIGLGLVVYVLTRGRSRQT